MHIHETMCLRRRRSTVMRRLIATIITLALLVAVGATSGVACSVGDHTSTVDQSHPTHAASMMAVEVVAENDGELEPILVALYHVEMAQLRTNAATSKQSRCLDVSLVISVPLYIAARRIQI